jgi:4a-hydroxytetrahydrobiopterin dehydratase
MSDRVSATEFEKAGLGGWRVEVDDTGEGTDRAVADFACGSFSAAGEFATKVAALCDQRNHHADIDIRYPDLVRVTTSSHDVRGLSERDLALAAAVSALFEA